MSQLAAQQAFLTSHASDADTRKYSDPTEEPKHYIDLESFEDFQHLPSDFSVVVAQFGWPALQSYGILPWTIVATVDSLTAQFRRADWNKACQSAADLGHYVGDAYQPLHCTVNYNGQFTGNDGIHSRYESSMLGQYISSLSIRPDSIRYVKDVYALALGITLHSNGYVDSILQADNAARTASGRDGGGAAPPSYYSTMWTLTNRLTQKLLQDATRDIGSLWYTAWVNAGVTAVAMTEETSDAASLFSLEQNYPNPFNPSTTIEFSVPGGMERSPGWSSGSSWVELGVYDVLGREVTTLVNEPRDPGNYAVPFTAAGLTSGVYYYRIRISGNGETHSEAKRMTVVR